MPYYILLAVENLGNKLYFFLQHTYIYSKTKYFFVIINPWVMSSQSEESITSNQILILEKITKERLTILEIEKSRNQSQ